MDDQIDPDHHKIMVPDHRIIYRLLLTMYIEVFSIHNVKEYLGYKIILGSMFPR